MPSLSLNGVTVQFPFTPYDCQKDYMKKVIECLENKFNGVLESPTGTGKTLCLLCATLAWREHFKDIISAQKIKERLNDDMMLVDKALESWGMPSKDDSTPTSYSDVPKIIYASRTHSQLTQVVNELKNTSYKPKVSVLGSREQMCINPEVMRLQSNHLKVHMCRAKVSTRTCAFYNNVEEKSTDKELVNEIVDMEDLVKFGNQKRACPYYLSRSLKQQADVIFMPYNYLLDPKSRKAHNIELAGSVVIFDEAHNVESTCEESTSFDITPYDLASAINAITRLLSDHAQEAHFGETSSQASSLKTDLKVVAKLKEILLKLEAAIDSFDVPVDKGITKPGIFIYELLERAHLTYNTKGDVIAALEQIIGYLAGQPGIFPNTSGLQKLLDIIQLVFCGDVAQIEAKAAHYKVHIHQDTSTQKKQKNGDPWASSTKKAGNILSYWCFSPGFSMQNLQDQGVRSIILTSGTLAPLSSFTSEMRIPFQVSLENSHVIERDQIFVSVIEQGPDRVPLSSAFDRRFDPENLSSLGNTVVNLTRIIPHGLLLFFPSFYLMEKTLEFWRDNGHANRIESVKPMFVEPKGKGAFTEAMEGYYNKVNDSQSRGGILAAVCRGKVSEGLDFADTFGRGVIITGVPFPPKMDPRINLKMQFLDEMNQRKSLVPGQKFLTGWEWYREQGFRAVNQAIGRVIRHKDDYGAIFLCDQRFKNGDAQSHLPSWVRPYVRFYDNFGNIVRDVCQFFRVAQKMRPVLGKNPASDPSMFSASGSQSSVPQCSGATSDTASQKPFTQKAKMLDVHTSTLKRRRTDEDTEYASIFKQYECQTQKSKTKPDNLFDALERLEHQRGGSAALGEETQSNLSTLSLQYDKRMDEMIHGGKRKIKLLQEQPSVSGAVTGYGKNGIARSFLLEMKSSLSQVSFEQIRQALYSYKKNDNLDNLLSDTSLLTHDPHTYKLYRGLYPFVRPHHRKAFDEKCQELTGTGCGYKPEHSQHRDQKKSGSQSVDEQPSELSSSSSNLTSSAQLNGEQLNGGGLQELREAPTDAGPKSQVQAAFLADVKKALGPEGSAQLFQAVNAYKKTDNYENMVTAAVALFTEKDEDFSLLIRFGNIIRPHHKKQYKEMLKALMGQSVYTAPV
ncbi:regulator of telomere elongation helicase 1 isoform X3 [Festucalex cinctus]